MPFRPTYPCTVDECKQIRDKAEALRAYAKQAGYGLEMQNQCAEIKLWAERRGGKLIQEMKESGKLATKGSGRPMDDDKCNTMLHLSDLGIERIDSSRWQEVASVPEEEFDKYIEEIKASDLDLTTLAFLKQAKAGQ